MRTRKIVTDSIKDQIYEVLKEEILTCKIKSGERLVEQTIADRMQVSRSPVREAIQLLVGDGLVVNITNRGAFVKMPSFEEISDMLEMRQLLEIYSLQKVNENMTETKRKKLLSLRDEMTRSKDRENYFMTEKKLWTTLIAMAGNSYIISTYGNIYTMLENFRASIFKLTPDSYIHTMGERTAIIDALLEGKMEEACEQTKNHIQHAAEIMREAMEQQQKKK